MPHPNVSRVEAARMREMGELAYHRMRLNDAMARIGTHSREFALMTAKRIGYFLAPQRRNWVLRGVEVMLACMALAGLVLMLRRRVPAGAAILVIWLTTPPIYFFLQSDERYRYPIEWTIFLCLGYALTALAEGVLPERVRQSGAPGEPLEFVEEQTR